jgi:hypothetical protein
MGPDMLTGSFTDLRRRGVAVFGLSVIHMLGWKKNTKF